jgi:hypothetical protein
MTHIGTGLLDLDSEDLLASSRDQFQCNRASSYFYDVTRQICSDDLIRQRALSALASGHAYRPPVVAITKETDVCNCLGFTTHTSVHITAHCMYTCMISTTCNTDVTRCLRTRITDIVYVHMTRIGIQTDS